MDKVIRITSAKAEELIQKFDEHTIDKCHKFGIIYQQKGQVHICMYVLEAAILYTSFLVEGMSITLALRHHPY